MSAFSQIELSRPPGDVVVPPEAWASTWTDRPVEPVCVGLRFVAEGDLQDARVEAFRRASRLYPDHEKTARGAELWEQTFKDGLVRWVVARGTCDANDVNSPWEGWQAAPEDMALEVLSDLGAQLIFDAWERMRVAADIGLVAASDEELLLLPDLVRRLPSLERLSPARALRVRRFLRFAMEELEEVAAPEEAASTRVDAEAP